MTLMQRRRALMEGAKEGGLPSEYQQVEYVSLSSGKKANNYIDTGVPVGGVTSAQMNLTKHTGNKTILVCANNNGLTNPFGDMANDVAGRVFSCSPTVASTDTNTTKMLYTLTKASSTASGTLALLGWSNANFVAIVRLYDCVVNSGNNIVFDAVPVYRKSDNAIGLYDFVSKSFRPTTGTFWTKGADV